MLGWRSLLATSLGTSTGITLSAYLVSLFVQEYVLAFGWTRGQIALGSLASLAAGLTAPLIGRAADHFGVKPVILICTIGYFVGALGMANLSGDIRYYYIAYFLIIVFGLGTTTLTWARFIAVDFIETRGLALSVAQSCVTITVLAMPPILQTINATYGWRYGWIAMGTLALAGGLVALLIAPASVRSASARKHDDRRAFRAALVTRDFMLLVGGMYVLNIPSGGIINQMAALIADHGFTAGDAAKMLSLFAISVFVGRFAAGVCLDRFNPSRVAFICFALPSIGCLLLMSNVTSTLALMMGIILAGMSQGAEGDVAPFIIARRFPIGAFGGVMGGISAATTAGTATGAILFGQIFDRSGNYDIALVIGAIAFVIGGICYFFVDSHIQKPEHLNAL